ncbi:MAG: hypothetical protein U1E23_14640 [Reyranellaceae bacterium]
MLAVTAGALVACLFGGAAAGLWWIRRLCVDERWELPAAILQILAAAATAIAVLGVLVVAAYAHDPYGSWRQPDNPAVSCCNGQDCRPTRAYLGEDGRWRAWDGRSHLCEAGGHVYCFSPTSPKG